MHRSYGLIRLLESRSRSKIAWMWIIKYEINFMINMFVYIVMTSFIASSKCFSFDLYILFIEVGMKI